MSEAMNERVLIQKESSDGIHEYTLDSEFLLTRTLTLYGEIDDNTANILSRKLLYLQRINSEPIKLIINSTGGEVYAGLTIYDLIKGSSCRIEGYVTGVASSIAAIILSGCEKGYRFILPHGRVMLHEPQINKIGISTASVKSYSDSLMNIEEILNNLIAENTDKTIDEIKEVMNSDIYMSASEAIEFGLCDKIVNTINL